MKGPPLKQAVPETEAEEESEEEQTQAEPEAAAEGANKKGRKGRTVKGPPP